MNKITAIEKTVAKLKPFDSKLLKPEEKINIEKDRVLEIKGTDLAPGPYVQVHLIEPLLFGDKECYSCLFFSGHIHLEGEKPKNKKFKLEVPYKSQTDNIYNPTGSCNVTSVAMCLQFLGLELNGVNQLEDIIYQQMERSNLSRHSPFHLAKVITYYGYNDNFVSNATIEDVQTHLESGYPCITHGYFTSFGHIIVIVGYDEDGFIVHDPYGEWFADGYIRNNSENNTRGKNLHYSYNLIKEVCIPDGEFWVHFISK